jgi:PqqD family protein of HPr-rel-A system
VAGSRYIADREDETVRAALDGLIALYHRPSGTTHILASPAPEILSALAAEPANARTLLDRLRGDFEIEGGEEAMASRLAELEAAGLVRRA